MFPVFFFTITSIIFQGNANTAPLEATQEIIFCDFPDMYLGGNSTGNGCIGNHDDPYFDDTFVLWNTTIDGGFFSGGASVNWVAEVPLGGWTHVMDGTTVFFAKIGAMVTYFPLLIMTLSSPVDIQSELGAPFIGFYSILWGLFIFGLYKGISPFTGGR